MAPIDGMDFSGSLTRQKNVLKIPSCIWCFKIYFSRWVSGLRNIIQSFLTVPPFFFRHSLEIPDHRKTGEHPSFVSWGWSHRSWECSMETVGLTDSMTQKVDTSRDGWKTSTSTVSMTDEGHTSPSQKPGGISLETLHWKMDPPDVKWRFFQHWKIKVSDNF